MAFMSLSPLSPPYRAQFPQVLSSPIGYPPAPNPILESQLPQLFSWLLMIPILALLKDLQLKPSRLQFPCSDACWPISFFQVSRPSDVERWFPSAIREYKESACFLIMIELTWWPIFIARQILENGVLQ